MDKKENIFTHKFLPVFGIVLLIVSFMFTSFSFGALEPIIFKGQTVNLTFFDTSTGFLLYDNLNNSYVVLHLARSSHGACFDSTRYFIVSEDDNFVTVSGSCAHYSCLNDYGLYSYDIETGQIVSLISSDKVWESGFSISKSQYSFVFVNKDVYTDSTYTVLTESSFFQVPPTVQLMNPMEVEQIPALIQKLTTILVPAGLIIFGLLLAPFLIKYRN